MGNALRALCRRLSLAAAFRLAPFVTVVGCAASSARHPVEIRPAADAVAMTRDADSAAFSFTLVVQNAGINAVFYQRCGT